MSGAPRRVVGIGSMVADRMHRVPRVLSADEKGILRPMGSGAVSEIRVGGVVLNHLGWAAALGLPVGIFGRQADDANGRFLRAAMDRLGIERHLVLDAQASAFSDIYVDDEGGRAIYMAPGATAETTAQHIRRQFADVIRSAARVTSEVSQLQLSTVREVIRIARAAHVPTLIDLDVPPSDAVPGLGSQEALEAVLRAADVLKPSKSAARELAPEAKGDALAMAVAMRNRYGNEAVIVTDGPAGCAIAAEDVAVRIPGYVAKEVVDVTGAGDAFLGGLVVAREAGLGWEDAGRLANACGCTCVEKLGAFPDDPARALARVRELYDGASIALHGPTAVDRPADEALDAFRVAVEELAALGRRLDPEALDRAVALVREAEVEGGRVHVTGIGKPEHVARYAASLFSSTGTPATFLHGTEVVHGSAGQVVAGDVVFVISNSGGTREMLEAVEAVRALGARVVAVTGALDSQLAKRADAVLDAGVTREGGGLGLAPRASAAAEVLVLAAVSAALEKERRFSPADYHARHPSGALGKQAARLRRTSSGGDR